MIKQIVVIGILILCCNTVSASSSTGGYNFEGDGASEYPNNGTMWAHVMANVGGTSVNRNTEMYNLGMGETVYVFVTATGSVKQRVDSTYRGTGKATWRGTGSAPGDHDIVCCFTTNSPCSKSKAVSYTITNTATFYTNVKAVDSYDATGKAGVFIKISTVPIPVYTISGATGCISNVTLYQKINDIYRCINESALAEEGDNYSFPIIDNVTYKLVFSNSHEHEFTSSGNEVYSYDACIHTTYRFEELCENLIPDSEGFYIEKIGSSVHAANYFYTSSGILDIMESPANNIYISAEPFSGQIGWFLNPITNDTTYILTNPVIAWGLKVVVQNKTDDTLINDAVVRVNQSCYCTDGYSVRQKKTVGGSVSYDDMSLQDASLWVYASGYKTLNENTTGYNVFLSGRSNFSSKTWVVELAPNTGNETSEWHETAHTTDIHFKDVDGNVTSKILDTDAYVRLYYQNNNSGGDSMTLKFQSSSTHTYFVDEQVWSIPHDESGYKEIATSYFTPWDYSYRATMYNSSIYGWNITIPLTVRNGTKETEQHYENLSTHLWFLNSDDGKIDYRTDMDIGVHACSNNTTLMTVDVEVYKDNVLLCYKNLTASDFINADFPYYYVYEPQYSYVSGSNYSVRMYGFDRTLLETNYVDCIVDTTVRKNRLTVRVKDRAGTPLTHSYIFLEGWGSLPTNGLSYNAYEGLEDGTYQYKASKSGYSTSGWSIINISGSDETVTYTLTSDTSGEALSAEKMTDDDIKAIFYPCIFFLLIIILIGGLKYAAS